MVQRKEALALSPQREAVSVRAQEECPKHRGVSFDLSGPRCIQENPFS